MTDRRLVQPAGPGASLELENKVLMNHIMRIAVGTPDSPGLADRFGSASSLILALLTIESVNHNRFKVRILI